MPTDDPNPSGTPPVGNPPPEDNTALKKALDQERQARKELERQMKAKEQAEAEAKAAAEKAELERKGEWEKLKATVEAEKAALAKERDEATAHFKAHLVKSELTAAIAAHKGDPLLMKLLEPEFEAILSPDGAPHVVTKGGEKTAPAQYVEKIKKDPAYGRFFEGSGVTGGGAPPVGGAPAAHVQNLSPVERMKAARRAS